MANTSDNSRDHFIGELLGEIVLLGRECQVDDSPEVRRHAERRELTAMLGKIHKRLEQLDDEEMSQDVMHENVRHNRIVRAGEMASAAFEARISGNREALALAR